MPRRVRIYAESRKKSPDVFVQIAQLRRRAKNGKNTNSIKISIILIQFDIITYGIKYVKQKFFRFYSFRKLQAPFPRNFNQLKSSREMIREIVPSESYKDSCIGCGKAFQQTQAAGSVPAPPVLAYKSGTSPTTMVSARIISVVCTALALPPGKMMLILAVTRSKT